MNKKKEEKIIDWLIDLEQVFHKAHDGAIILDTSGKIIWINIKAANIFGMKKSQIIGKNFISLRLFTQDTTELIKNNFENQLRGKNNLYTLKIKNRKGVKKFINCTLLPIIQSEVLHGYVVIVNDQTELEKLQKRIEESEQKYRKIFENSFVSIMLTDNHERLRLWNPFTEKLLGYKSNELYLKPIKSFYPREEWKKLRNENIREKGFKSHFETKMYRRDKTIIDIDISLSVIRDSNNKISGSIGVIRNISERLAAERKLEENEERYRDLFENANDLIQSIDINGNYIYVNKKWKKTMGYNEKEIKKLTIWNVIRKDHQKNCKEILRRIIAGEAISDIETVFVSKKEREIIVSGNISCVKKNGKTIATRGIFRDITEKKKFEEKLKKFNEELEEKIRKRTSELERSKKQLELAFNRLKELDELKDNFISNVSHELRTPLTSIQSYNQLISEGILGPINYRQKEALNLIVSSTKHLASIIGNILDISKYDYGKMPFQRTAFDFKEIIKTVIEEFNPTLQSLNARIIFNNETNQNSFRSFEIYADKEKLLQVTRNLVSNSIKYRSARDLIIRITIVKKGKNFMIRFKDNGIGIKKENISNLFNRFYQVDASLTKKIQGTGLGLSIVKSIIQLHRGTINVKSEYSKYTEFVISLPKK